MIDNVGEFLKEYICDLCFDLRNAIFNNDRCMKDELQIKLETALEIATGIGIKIEVKEDTITLPYVLVNGEEM